MLIERAAVPPFEKNGFVVSCERTHEAIVIDPGDEVDLLIQKAKAARVRVVAILLTHAHLDHITGVGRARAEWNVPVWLHEDDRFLYDGLEEQGRMFDIKVPSVPPIDSVYDLRSPIQFGDYVVNVTHTPGHSPGSVCLAISRKSGDGRELFVGDTLFADGIGRTDLPGGHFGALMRSIQTVLFAHPDDTVLHPGHGPDTTIGRERRTIFNN